MFENMGGLRFKKNLFPSPTKIHFMKSNPSLDGNRKCLQGLTIETGERRGQTRARRLSRALSSQVITQLHGGATPINPNQDIIHI